MGGSLLGFCVTHHPGLVSYLSIIFCTRGIIYSSLSVLVENTGSLLSPEELTPCNSSVAVPTWPISVICLSKHIDVHSLLKPHI